MKVYSFVLRGQDGVWMILFAVFEFYGVSGSDIIRKQNGHRIRHVREGDGRDFSPFAFYVFRHCVCVDVVFAQRMPEFHGRNAVRVAPLDEIAYHHVRIRRFVYGVCHVRLRMVFICRVDDIFIAVGA